VFQGARILLWFDLFMIAVGANLLLDHWRPLTGSNVEAIVIQAVPQCTYSLYVFKRTKRGYNKRLPLVSGNCAQNENEARQLIKAGYNHVRKGWTVTATVDEGKKEIEFHQHDANWLATERSWEVFLWGKQTLEPGAKINLLRSLTGNSVTPLREPQKVGDKLVALHRVIIGLILFFGTLAIHGVPYWEQQNRHRN
jgi:hypothetical protein